MELRPRPLVGNTVHNVGHRSSEEWPGRGHCPTGTGASERPHSEWLSWKLELAAAARVNNHC